MSKWNVMLLLTLLYSPTGPQAITPCSTEATDGCECEGGSAGYTLSCDRVRLARVPTLSEAVTELELFRADLNDTHLRANKLRQAHNLRVITIKSCDLTQIGDDCLIGLYSLQTLDLSDNRISSLPEKAFQDLNLLTKLDLSYNSLTALSANTFAGLSNLNTLDLSYNRLERLPNDLLIHLPSLKTLRLDDSLPSISELPPLLLSNAPSLETLVLANNQLAQIQDSLFKENGNLVSLDLQSNQLTTIPEAALLSLRRLEVLQLQGNPFRCDCTLSGYRDWLEMLRSSPPDGGGVCSEPAHLRGQHIANLPREQFFCSPADTSSSPREATTSTTTDFSTEWVKEPTEERRDSTWPPPRTTEEGPAGQTRSQAEARERGVIIGSCVAAAVLLIAANLLAIACIRRYRRRRATRKVKYILRPEDVNPSEKGQSTREGWGSGSQEGIRVDDVGYGYTISNGHSGLYHTGSLGRARPADRSGSRSGQSAGRHLYGSNSVPDIPSDLSVHQLWDSPYRESSEPMSFYHNRSASQPHRAAEYAVEEPLTVSQLDPPGAASPLSGRHHSAVNPTEAGRRMGPRPSEGIAEWPADPQRSYVNPGYTDVNPGYADVNPGYTDEQTNSAGSVDSGVDSNSPLAQYYGSSQYYPDKPDNSSTPYKRYESLQASEPNNNHEHNSHNPGQPEEQYSSQSLKRIRNVTYV